MPTSANIDLTLADSHLVFEGISGSYAYGLAGPDSDLDRRRIFAWRGREFWQMDQPAQTLQSHDSDYTSWELGHFLRMLRKGSVNAFELLWLPEDCIEQQDDTIWPWLVRHRKFFFTEEMWKGWRGVIRGHQHEYDKLVARKAPLRDRGKEVSHIVRLVDGLSQALVTGEFPVRPGNVDLLARAKFAGHENEVLLADAYAQTLIAAIDKLYARSPWPSLTTAFAGSDILNQFLVAQRARLYREER